MRDGAEAVAAGDETCDVRERRSRRRAGALSVTKARVVVQGKQQLLGFDPKTQTSDGSRFYAAPSDALASIAMFAVTAAAAV